MTPPRNVRRLAPLLVAGLALGTPASAAFDPAHFAWEQVLQAHVRDGRVDYKGLRSHPEALDRYLDSLAALRPAEYDSWSREAQLAFWINAYNALTVKAVLDHYPIKPSWQGWVRYPKNSIRQIPGVWDKLRFRVMEREVTLDEIEHGTLRARFKEPRVHMALVCASIGCPPLRGEAFTGTKLDAQLDDQAGRFLRSKDKFRIDRDAGVVYLSPIFQWFGGDFMQAYAPSLGFGGRGAEEGAALNFISRSLGEDDRAFLANGGFKVRYLDYDWSLNERPRP
ncbi:MAG: DUF547 domain-containing protein [Elusimicrobia bacterium]|nr:DUF547 domain-containing protein [Elusimicrobiota bacterium]